MIKSKKKIIVSICIITTIILLIVGFFFANYREHPPMTQEQVIDCFETNFESLEIVAEYLINHSHEEIIIDNYSIELLLVSNPYVVSENRRESIADEQVADALRQLRNVGYGTIHGGGESVVFKRDSRGERSSYGWFTTGVYFSLDGRVITEGITFYGNTPLSEPNWYFYEHKRNQP